MNLGLHELFKVKHLSIALGPEEEKKSPMILSAICDTIPNLVDARCCIKTISLNVVCLFPIIAIDVAMTKIESNCIFD